jgi:hypothetical protein
MRIEDVRVVLAERFEPMVGPLPPTLRFIDDRVVDYGYRIYLRDSDLFGLDDAARWEVLLAPGAGWIHLNLMRLEDGSPVVAVRRGPEAGREGVEPEINVSIEPKAARLES